MNTLQQQNILADLPPLVRWSDGKLIAEIDGLIKMGRRQAMIPEGLNTLYDARAELAQAGILSRQEIANLCGGLDIAEDMVDGDFRRFIQALLNTLNERLDHAE
jgi:hypothetical protein